MTKEIAIFKTNNESKMDEKMVVRNFRITTKHGVQQIY